MWYFDNYSNFKKYFGNYETRGVDEVIFSKENSAYVLCHKLPETTEPTKYCRSFGADISKNQENPMASGQCCENPPTLSPNSGAGEVQELGGLKSYVCGPPDSKVSVVLVTDVFGYEAPNLRKLADKVAAAGFYTVVPDFFRGDPYDPENHERPLLVWFKDHGTDQGFEYAKPVIEALKSKGITKIGAAGFCWGGKVVVELAKYANIQAAVLLHPSLVTLDDIQGVKVPMSILGAEIDQVSPPELVKQFEVALNAKPEVNAFVKIFPGVSHGWSVRYSDEDEVAVKKAEEAHSDMLNWFVKYLK